MTAGELLGAKLLLCMFMGRDIICGDGEGASRGGNATFRSR